MTIQFHRLRPEKETRAGMSRRTFLMTTTMAGITTGSLLGNTAFAASGFLDDAQKARLLRMIQDIYPHPDVLQLSHYEAIAATVLKNAELDAAAAKGLTEGLTKIEA